MLARETDFSQREGWGRVQMRPALTSIQSSISVCVRFRHTETGAYPPLALSSNAHEGRRRRRGEEEEGGRVYGQCVKKKKCNKWHKILVAV